MWAHNEFERDAIFSVTFIIIIMYSTTLPLHSSTALHPQCKYSAQFNARLYCTFFAVFSLSLPSALLSAELFSFSWHTMCVNCDSIPVHVASESSQFAIRVNAKQLQPIFMRNRHSTFGFFASGRQRIQSELCPNSQKFVWQLLSCIRYLHNKMCHKIWLSGKSKGALQCHPCI